MLVGGNQRKKARWNGGLSCKVSISFLAAYISKKSRNCRLVRFKVIFDGSNTEDIILLIFYLPMDRCRKNVFTFFVALPGIGGKLNTSVSMSFPHVVHQEYFGHVQKIV